MRALVSAFVKKTVPSRLLNPLIASRSRRHQAYVLRTLGIAEVAERFVAKHGLQVRYGPFAGMKYTSEAVKNRLILPKLLGTYECELHEIIAYVQQAGYDTIVDVGCGEGYYTTGLALTTKARILAYDAEKHELEFAGTMAAANGVAAQIDFRRWCTPEELMKTVRESERLFVLSDCEGYEIELFTPSVVSRLKRVDVLIELHGNVKAELMRRFESSHSLQVIPFDRTNRGRRPELDEMSEEDRARAVDECRFPQEWLWPKAKS